MGNVHISIDCVGSHHNANNPTDIDRLFLEFVEKLKENNIVVNAIITYGGAEHWEEVKHRLTAATVPVEPKG